MALLEQEPEIEEFVIDPTNYATDPEVAARAVAYVTGLTTQARSDRQAFNNTAMACYNIWETQRDENQFYTGRADIYIPAGHKAIERNVGKLYARLFPTGDDYIDVRPLTGGEDFQDEVAKALDAAKALMWYDLHESMRLRAKFIVWLRQLGIVGTSPLAYDYVTQAELGGMRGRRQARLARPTSPARLLPQSYRPEGSVGPTCRVVDFFTWYVWPASANEIDDAVLVFEDQLVTESQLRRWRDMGRYHFEDAALRQYLGSVPEKSIWAASERLRQRGVDSAGSDPLYVVTVAYGEWTPSEDPGADRIPFQFAFVNDTLCIQARQNPWWHQRPPYRVGRLHRYADEFYGRAWIYFTRRLQYQLNDTASQTFDAMTYGLMPVAAVDPAFIQDPDILQWRPAAKWPVPPQGVKFFQMPDVHRQGFDAIRQLYELIQEASGASTGGQYLPTLGIARGAETATGQQLLLAQSDIDVNLITQDIEEDFLEPLCQDIDTLEQQFLPENEGRLLRALGPKAIPLLQNGMRVRREQMQGTRVYTWVGSRISEEKLQFQNQGPSLLGILSKIPPSSHGRVDLLPFIRDLVRSFGFSNAEQIIKIRKRGAGYPPALEHAVMKAGHPILPTPGETYRQHLAEHDAVLPQAMAEGWGDRLQLHIAQTLELALEDEALTQQLQAPNFAGRGLPPPPDGAPGNGGPLGGVQALLTGEGGP